MTTTSLLKPLVDGLSQSHPGFALSELEKAFTAAEKAHSGQLRKSGEDYITHPVAVAQILIDLGMDLATVIAALLHDTVEDTSFSIEQIKNQFGDEVSSLVDGVTKLDKLTYGPTAEAETLRKMVIAMSRDIRVLVIKLADRLHNARTWQFIEGDKAKKKARETIDIYAPLAHRLGMNAIKWELEDLSFNLVGIRILVESVRDCYGVLGSIHARWSPVPGRFKDYIAMPKFNLYQSLHTTVIGPNGKAVEIQIRTFDMHARAEFGIAAHWKYKQKTSDGGKSPDVLWLRQLHEWQQESEDVTDFLETLRYDLRTPEVFVFTPKGSVIALPSGSTPVDFAYAVHTEVGNKCVGAKVNGKLVPLAKVNGKLVPLESHLINGDVVEVVINKGLNAAPSHDWLNFVTSSRARSKIKAWFSKERKEEAIEAGQESIARQMRKAGLPIQKILGGHALLELAHELRYEDIESLYESVGNGHVSAHSVIEKLMLQIGAVDSHPENEPTPLQTRVRRERKSVTGIDVEGADDVLVKLARCCAPVPGDEITGFITRGSGVSVHRSDCINMGDLKVHQFDRIVGVKWNNSAKSTFLVNIQVEALDRARLLSDVTKALSDQHVNILSASVVTNKDQTAISKFLFEMADASHLDTVLAAVRSVEGVYDVNRVFNN